MIQQKIYKINLIKYRLLSVDFAELMQITKQINLIGE